MSVKQETDELEGAVGGESEPGDLGDATVLDPGGPHPADEERQPANVDGRAAVVPGALPGQATAVDVRAKDHHGAPRGQGATADDQAQVVQTAPPRRSARQRTLTEKGLLYNLEVLNVKRQRAHKQLSLKIDQIQEVMYSAKLPELQMLYSHLLTLYETFLDVNDSYFELSDDKEHDLWYTQRLNEFKSFKESVETIIRMKAAVKPSSHKGSVRSKSSGKISAGSIGSRSSQHSGSRSSLVSRERLQEEQRRAELAVMKESLLKKEALAKKRLELEMEAERIKLEEEIARTTARSRVLDRMDETDSVSRHSRRSAKVSPMNPKAQPFTPKMRPQTLTSSAVPQMPLTTPALTTGNSSDEMVLSVVKHLRKPQLDVGKFDGNPLNYRKFMRQFQSRVMNNTDDTDEVMTYLEQLTTGEVNKIVSSFIHLDSGYAVNAVLAELEDRFGDPETVATAFIEKALKWPQIKPNDCKGINAFSIFLVECMHATKCIDAMKMLEYPDTLRKLLSKLPFHLHDKWRTVVLKAKDKYESVTFCSFVDFVKTEAKKMNHPIFGREVMQTVLEQPMKGQQKQKSASSTKGSFASVSEGSSSKTKDSNSKDGKVVPKAFQKPCLFCDGDHSLKGGCEKFMQKSFSDRLQFIRTKSLCYGCLRSGHQKASCRVKETCSECRLKHPSILHIAKSPAASVPGTEVKPPESTSSAVSKAAVVSTSNCASSHVTFAIVPVRVHLKNRCTYVDTYAFLDSGSNTSFCSESLMAKLGASGKKMQLTIDTMGAQHKMVTYSIKGLLVSDLNDQHSIEIGQVYSKPSIPALSSHIPQQSDIDKWSHLSDIELPKIDAEIGLLIGNDVSDAYTPLEVRTGPSGSPHGSRTRLGWAVFGLSRDQSDINLQCHRSEVVAVSSLNEDRKLDGLMKRFINMEFPEGPIERREASVEDKLFMSKVNKSITLQNGHYEIALPFKNDELQLPNNRSQADQRLHSLEKRLQRDKSFHNDYVEFMDKIIANDYAELVPSEEIGRNDGRVWYIPHHGVYNPNKPGKIRVVFDCAATHLGISLNKMLLPGPDLTNSLLGVLLKFRQDMIAVIADIESMFYRVRVKADDKDCLRFLWWPGGDLGCKPRVYRMLVHIFGAASSPACANVALRQTALDNKHLFNSDVCEAVLKNFYVDDFLKTFQAEEEALSMVFDVADLCSRGGFRLTKWVSTSRTVLKAIPSEERGKQLREVDMDKSDLPEERALGVKWNVEDDQFTFKIVKRSPSAVTRRVMLSMIGSVFDPLGFISPFVLTAKLMLQDLCCRNIPWDQELSGDDLSKWLKWESELSELDKFSISRCLKPNDFGEIDSCQIHHFADASDHGYGVATYVRLSDKDGRIHCSLLMSRARVNPIKKMTVPRLELTAAMSAVRLHHNITTQLEYHVDSVYFWTDSMTVLRYLWNESTRFYTFVANRVSFIREATSIEQWHFVPSTMNPADDVSRGLDATALLESARWTMGPDFLWFTETEWPQLPEGKGMSEDDDDPEIRKIKKTVNIAVTSSSEDVIDALINKFSSWMKLKMVVAWLLHAKRKLKMLVQQRKDTDMKTKMKKEAKKEIPSLTVEMLNEAEMFIFKHEQGRFLADELAELSYDRDLTKRNPLYKLDPILQDGLIRVGGRLERADLPFDVKHPIILPGDSPISRLILMNAHESLGHLGKGAILANVRQRFWIMRASQLIRTLLTKCVVCRRYRAPCLDQKMGDLPEDRTVSGEPPFSRVGMDFFGPFLVKRARTVVKRWGVVFTCLASRAIHLDVAASLDTDSCINVIRRFTSRRGPVRIMWSDNGTNFVGAERELREELQQCEASKVHDHLLEEQIEWHFNPPAASHFGGVWERMIRLVRKVLYGLMHKHHSKLDDDSLMTLFCEVESIVNSRPLTEISDDSKGFEIITPNHLLLLREGHLPVTVASRDDSYSRRRWKHIQYLADEFWKQWRNGYLLLLQERQKWRHPKRNVAVGDIVLLADNTPRNSWSLGKVVEANADKKGMVRIVQVKTQTSVLRRPIHKVVLLIESDDD